MWTVLRGGIVDSICQLYPYGAKPIYPRKRFNCDCSVDGDIAAMSSAHLRTMVAYGPRTQHQTHYIVSVDHKWGK